MHAGRCNEAMKRYKALAYEQASEKQKASDPASKKGHHLKERVAWRGWLSPPDRPTCCSLAVSSFRFKIYFNQNYNFVSKRTCCSLAVSSSTSLSPSFSAYCICTFR